MFIHVHFYVRNQEVCRRARVYPSHVVLAALSRHKAHNFHNYLHVVVLPRNLRVKNEIAQK